MHISAGHAHALLRAGNGLFWDFWPGEGFMELRPRSAIHSLILQNELAPMVKKSIFALPWRALGSLAEMRAYMSFPIQSATEERPTARSYSATCAALSKVTVSKYRRVLKAAGYIAVQRNFHKQWKDSRQRLGAGEFRHRRNRRVALRRLADTVFVDRGKVFFTEKGQPRINYVNTSVPSSSSKTRYPDPLEFTEYRFKRLPHPIIFMHFLPTRGWNSLPKLTGKSRKNLSPQHPIQPLPLIPDGNGDYPEELSYLEPIDPKEHYRQQWERCYSISDATLDRIDRKGEHYGYQSRQLVATNN